MANPMLSIGDLARRTGLTVSAIRFYEARGLIQPERTSGNQRRFRRSDIRRLSFILIVQKLGFSLTEIEAALACLPQDRAPSRAEWAVLAEAIQQALSERAAVLQRTQALLDACIGCGCLSLDACGLYNPQDRAGDAGPGPQYVLGGGSPALAPSASDLGNE
ncbi:MAG: redox-sensitive transcriptional activator SoxR [Sphingomonadales bacterium]|nr:redox-sensitive transcriptional activator SoxR [Sphingomonadales bacterium]